MSRGATVWSYRVEHDVGLAPNPFHDLCTMAVCKPRIRKNAKEGDFLLGMSSADKKRTTNPLQPVFIMLVDRRIHFNEYWATEEYADRKSFPSGSWVWQAGDNIYRHDGDGWHQARSWHSTKRGGVSKGNLKRDTTTSQHVLIGRRYASWGVTGPELPAHLHDLIHHGIGETPICDPDRTKAFVDWAEPLLSLRRVGWPQNWKL